MLSASYAELLTYRAHRACIPHGERGDYRSYTPCPISYVFVPRLPLSSIGAGNGNRIRISALARPCTNRCTIPALLIADKLDIYYMQL